MALTFGWEKICLCLVGNNFWKKRERGDQKFFFKDGRQGDRIGRIFAYWAIVFFGQFF
jgi:hypothetical protein